MAKEEINGVEVNGSSIITALKIIKQVCVDNRETKGRYCPFNTCDDTRLNCEGACGITELEPDNWEIFDYKKFHALR